jgi:hypothetical protein
VVGPKNKTVARDDEDVAADIHTIEEGGAEGCEDNEVACHCNKKGRVMHESAIRRLRSVVRR